MIISSRTPGQHGGQRVRGLREIQRGADYLREGRLLSKVLHDTTQQEVQAQESLVNALEAQATVEQKINALKTAQKSNATVAEAKKGSGGEDFKAEAEAARRAQEEADRLWAEHYRTALGNLQQSEREKIVATEQGSQARLTLSMRLSKKRTSTDSKKRPSIARCSRSMWRSPGR